MRTGRYKPSETKTKIMAALLIALAIAGGYHRSIAKQVMDAFATKSALAEEVEEEAINEKWVASIGDKDVPCTRTGEKEWVCMGKVTTSNVKAVKTPVKAVTGQGTIPQKYWDLATKICVEQKQDKVECPRYLLAVATVESVFGTRMVGDGGLSQGWFHIYHIHNKTVSLECKMDFYCSGTWSLKRMIGNGYNDPKTREWAVASHNSKTPEQNALYLGMVKAALLKIK